MNRFIARVFSWLLAVLHVAFLISLFGVVVAFYSDSNSQLRSSLIALGIQPNWFLLIIIISFLSYVVIMGLLSTFVAINDNLEKLLEKIGSS